MKIIFSKSLLKRASWYNISIDDLEIRINKHFHNCILLCSPFPGTNAYKGYYSGVDRIIMFHVTDKWVLYPVYVGDKNDAIAKNITASLVKNHAQHWLDMFLVDLQNKECFVRHINKKS